jgi:hypothetical protein
MSDGHCHHIFPVEKNITLHFDMSSLTPWRTYALVIIVIVRLEPGLTHSLGELIGKFCCRSWGEACQSKTATTPHLYEKNMILWVLRN